MNTNEEKALEILTRADAYVRRYNGVLTELSQSTEWLDYGIPQNIRDMAKDLAKVTFEDADLAERAFLALAWVCRNDDWATREVAGRFLSLCKRLVLVSTINRHPRAWKFESLTDALLRGRATAAQLKFARTLAAEVRA